MINKKNDAFTLIEVIIVLGITAAIFLLGFSITKNTKQRLDERQFWKTFDQAWSQVATESEQMKTNAQIEFYSTKINFIYYSSTTKGYKRNTKIIKIPTTFKLTSNWATVYFFENGGAKMQSVSYYSSVTKKQYVFIPQIGYGRRYRIEEK